MRPSRIWLAVAALYTGFFLWYTGVRGPLTPEEVDRFVEVMAEGGAAPERLATLRQFLEEDPGGDFVIANAILFRERPLEVGDVRPGESSREVLDRYMAFMWPELLMRACHPVVAGRAAATTIEAWGIENGEEWSMAGLMRYRSRRDMLEIVAKPAFRDSHEFKFAAIEKTIAFPISPYIQLGGPRVVVGLALFALAAVLHLRLGRR